MGARVSIYFSDAGAGVEGVAIPGAGTLVSLEGELTATAPPELSGEGPWRLAAPGAYELQLVALAAPAELAAGTRVWLCSVRGALESRALAGLAAITSSSDGDVALERSLSIPFAPDLCVALAAARRRERDEHGSERLEGAVFRGQPPAPAPIARPRLSTVYDDAGVPTHAGLELWEDEESDYPLRIGGEAVTNGELVHPDGARSRIVFLAWHEGSHRAGGSYTITRAGG